MRVGFTGSRNGMTNYQRGWVESFLATQVIKSFHHGDCLGADSEAHDIAASLGLYIVVHPPIDPKLRAHKVGNEIRMPGPYLERDRDIVDECDLLIATPSGPERHGSGTWYTASYARAREKDLWVIKTR